jgi:hypothetical protein
VWVCVYRGQRVCGDVLLAVVVVVVVVVLVSLSSTGTNDTRWEQTRVRADAETERDVDKIGERCECVRDSVCWSVVSGADAKWGCCRKGD